jgi:DNA-binding NarL/FixJ family response regulator
LAHDKKPVKRARPKVLIVDDHPAVREALAIRISQAPDLEVCGEAQGVADALEVVREKRPDVAIIDIALKKGDGIDLIKRIRARTEDLFILVWSMYDERLYAERALRAGANGYITKEHATDRIVEALREVLSGKVYLSPTMTDALLHRAVGRPKGNAGEGTVETLSDRELEVFRMIGKGLKTNEIAEQLHLSVRTVWTYRDRIREKLDLGDGAALVRYATQWALEKK